MLTKKSSFFQSYPKTIFVERVSVSLNLIIYIAKVESVEILPKYKILFWLAGISLKRMMTKFSFKKYTLTFSLLPNKNLLKYQFLF